MESFNFIFFGISGWGIDLDYCDIEWFALKRNHAISKMTVISDRIQGKPLSITVIQVYAPTTNAEEAEVEWFSEDLQDLLELTPKRRRRRRSPFHYRGLECKNRKSRNTWSNRQIWPWNPE